MVKVHHPVLFVNADIWNNKNCVASVRFAIRTYPFIAEVTLEIVVKNESIFTD